MNKALYREDPFAYLNLANVVMIGLAEKKAEKKIMGMASDQRRLFAVDTKTGDITYYKLERQLLLQITQECCDQQKLQEKILSSGNEDKITFKGFIPGSSILKIQFDNKGTLSNKGSPEINIYTNINNRIYTLYFLFGEPNHVSAKNMRENIMNTEAFDKINDFEVQLRPSQAGGSKRKTKRNLRKHKKQQKNTRKSRNIRKGKTMKKKAMKKRKTMKKKSMKRNQ